MHIGEVLEKYKERLEELSIIAGEDNCCQNELLALLDEIVSDLESVDLYHH